MLKSLFSNRLFIGALAFFVFCVCGSLLYSWYIVRTTENEMARDERLLQGAQKQNETRPAETVNDPTKNETPVKQVPDTAGATPTVGDPPPTRADMQQDPSVSETADVSDIEAEIIAEEEKAEEALSAEELKIKKRLDEIQEELMAIARVTGGKIKTSTHPEETRRMLDLQLERIEIMREGMSAAEYHTAKFFFNLAKMGNNRNARGELPVSQLSKMASYMEAEVGDSEMTRGLRAIVEKAVDNGDEVVKPQHAAEALK